MLYSPALLIQVTVTGQLALLMLIERLSDIVGVEVTSANTDGVTLKCHRDNEADVALVVNEWEALTGFQMERTDYRSVYSADVSNYIAVLTTGAVKLKGVYNYVDRLDKNPDAQIVARAVVDYLTLGASIEATVTLCDDLRQFLCVRKVTGGAACSGQDLGKVIRWYYSRDVDEAFVYKTNNNVVPDTFGAQPCVRLPEGLPADLDKLWYIETANTMVQELGVPR